MSHLLEIHGRATSQDTVEWITEEAAFRERLKNAKEELSHYPEAWLGLTAPPFSDE